MHVFGHAKVKWIKIEAKDLNHHEFSKELLFILIFNGVTILFLRGTLSLYTEISMYKCSCTLPFQPKGSWNTNKRAGWSVTQHGSGFYPNRYIF